jgi:CubicO group peptidase (beta-lactamase class C family)
MVRMRTRQNILLAALMALAACSSPETAERVVEPRGFKGTAPRGTALMRQAMQQGHDAARAEVGLPPLVWSDALADGARTYAQTLARTGRFEHSPESLVANRVGENLWTGTRGAYRFDEMIGHWRGEKRDYLHLPVPNFSRTGKWQDVAHYGQLVSRRTLRYGCAFASNKRDDYLVCRYDPPGNLVGATVY